VKATFLLYFVRSRTASFSDIGLAIENRETGFFFDFKFVQFSIKWTLATDWT